MVCLATIMAYQVTVKKEDKDKAVKTKPAGTVQIDFEGKEVKEPKPICPIVMGACLKGSCVFYLKKEEKCSIVMIAENLLKW